nr:MAG TPA: Mature oligodendrocyte transmembrane protein [Caudoviricetes sp.]
MQGWDIKGWFTTPQAYLIYALVVVFALAIGFFIVNSRS